MRHGQCESGGETCLLAPRRWRDWSTHKPQHDAAVVYSPRSTGGREPWQRWGGTGDLRSPGAVQGAAAVGGQRRRQQR